MKAPMKAKMKEGSAKDMREDKVMAKKAGMDMAQWEGSAADMKHDMGSMKKGGKVKKMAMGGSVKSTGTAKRGGGVEMKTSGGMMKKGGVVKKAMGGSVRGAGCATRGTTGAKEY